MNVMKLKEKRKGHCSKCGSCCKYVIIYIDKKGADKKLLDYRNIEYFVEGKFLAIKIKSRCRYLTENNLCSINGRKPKSCKDAPYSKNHNEHFKECTYYFE